MDTLLELIDTRAGTSSERPALLGVAGPALSYGELVDEIGRIAAVLSASGVKRGDRVAIVVPNGPAAATSFLGVASLATAAPLNPAYSAEELGFLLSDLGAVLVLADAGAASASAAAKALGIPLVPFPFGAAAPGAARWEPAQADDVALVLHTSGTTARPKLVPLTQRNLVSSARSIAESLALTAEDRCLNVMPLFHVHGLVGALLSSLAAGASTVCAPSAGAMEVLDWLESAEPTWLTAVPTVHRALGTAAAGRERPASTGRLRLLRSCSSALPPGLMAELERRFGVPVVEAYGMTEASHQMAQNPLPPGARKPGSVGLPRGAELRVVDEQGRVLLPGSTGEIQVRGAGVTSGYERNPDANRQAFQDGWFRTGDQGRLDEEGYVFLTGRIKEIVNRGGEKVSPREVDEALLEHPAIQEAAAFAIPHATLGEDLACAVVLKSGASAEPAELRAFLLERIASFKVPSVVLVVASLPKGPTGKLSRSVLAEKLASDLESVYLAPSDAVQGLIVDVWQEILEVAPIGVRDNFFVRGGDSLRGTRVITRLNQFFDLELAVTQAFRHPTIEELANEVRKAASPERLREVTQALDDVLRSSDEEASPP